MKARTTGRAAVLAAGALLLAACGSGGQSAGESTSTPAISTPAISTPAISTPAMSAASSTAAGSSALGSATTSSAPSSSGVGSVQLDGTTIAWFTTLCSGINSLTALQGTQNVTSTAELGTLLSSTGDAVNQTVTSLKAKPAPTFDGGAEFAAQADKALSTFGSTLSEFGQRATALPAGDAAAVQQFTKDFQAAGQNFNGLGAGVKLDPAIEKAVVAQAPGCDVLATAVGAGRSGGAGSAASSAGAAPSS